MPDFFTMTRPEDLGVVEALAGSFMRTLGQNLPSAIHYFANEAWVNWNGQKASGKAEIFELFKSLPLFHYKVLSCDCQKIVPRPLNTIVILTGFLIISGDSKRFHASFFVEQRNDGLSAVIKCMNMSFCPDLLERTSLDEM